jgi:hydroxyethylthiazole kinase
MEIQVAIEAAKAEGKPWCLDPVGCGGTASRTANAVKFMSMRPTVVRGNAR